MINLDLKNIVFYTSILVVSTGCRKAATLKEPAPTTPLTAGADGEAEVTPANNSEVAAAVNGQTATTPAEIPADSYLTCGTIAAPSVAATANNVVMGCLAMSPDGKLLNVSTYKLMWTLADGKGAPVSKVKREVSAQSNLQCLWEVDQNYVGPTLQVSVAVTTASGATTILREKSSAKVTFANESGKIQ